MLGFQAHLASLYIDTYSQIGLVIIFTRAVLNITSRKLFLFLQNLFSPIKSKNSPWFLSILPKLMKNLPDLNW